MIEPVVIGPCTLFNADCRDVLPLLEGVDAVVTDPPYGIGLHNSFNSGTRRYPDGSVREPKRGYVPIVGDDAPFDPSLILGFPFVLMWGADHYASRLPDGGRWLVWDKRCGVCPPRDQACCEIAWCSSPGVRRVFRHLWDGMVRDSERGEERRHPHQKPIAVMDWCLSFAPSGTVLDPFMGSGTTGVACVQTGRKFIGCEIDPQHFATACRRIRAAVAAEKSSLFPAGTT